MIVIGWSLRGRIVIEMLDKLTHPERATSKLGIGMRGLMIVGTRPLARRRGGSRRIHWKRASLQQLKRSSQKRSIVWPMQPAGVVFGGVLQPWMLHRWAGKEEDCQRPLGWREG